MNAEQQQSLRAVVEQEHGCRATFREVAHVVETHKGKTVWEGDVSVFDVDHKDAKTAYAWADPVAGSKTRLRYFAVLGKPPINSASDAVKVAIAARWRNELAR
jgi:hypothetical protein